MHNQLSKFDKNLPGSILKDIECFLLYIQNNELELTGKKGLLPSHCIPVLNSKMTHSLKINLKREQQISYPHINGLYLLTRALGLIEIQAKKSKRYLTVNNLVLDKWGKLNTTEQFLTLLCTWFFRSDDRLINKGGSTFYGKFYGVLNFLKKLKKDLFFKNLQDQMYEARMVGSYNIALLEMFGMITIKDKEGYFEKSWHIDNISRTNFGNVFTSLLLRKKDFGLEIVSGDENKNEANFLKKMESLFPSCKKLLEREKRITNDGLYILKISLTKEVWRRINIQGSDTLEDLAYTILGLFEFDDDHLYQFSYTDKFGVLRTVHHSYTQESPSVDEVKLGNLDILIGDTFEFLFDFGDCWKFEIKIEAIDENSTITEPSIIESQGIAPKQYAY